MAVSILLSLALTWYAQCLALSVAINFLEFSRRIDEIETLQRNLRWMKIDLIDILIYISARWLWENKIIFYSLNCTEIFFDSGTDATHCTYTTVNFTTDPMERYFEIILNDLEKIYVHKDNAHFN